ncbi:MAG: nitroreductase [Bacteroidaceae bacterium]|nr:nitroreductase [Bacteroidaceae bacterium]
MNILKTLFCGLSLMAAVSCGGDAAKADSCCKDSSKSENEQCSEKKECCNAAIDNMMSRRSIRDYKPDAVSRGLIKQIMLCGINAPNGQNKQSWEVRVVDTKALQNEIKGLAGGERIASCFYNAPVWVFIARDKSYDFSTIDCGLLSENIMLAANSMGIGSVCLGSPVRFIFDSPDKEQILGKLGFSDGYELCICIALGYPNSTPDAKPRNINKVKFID